MATGLAVVAAIGAVVGAVQQKKISKAQKRQNRLTNKIAAIDRQRSTKRAIAASRIQVADTQAVGFQLGVGGSTAVQGATAGILGDTATALGASNLQLEGQQFLSGLSDDISGFQQTGATAGAVSSIAGGLASNPRATAAITNLV